MTTATIEEEVPEVIVEPVEPDAPEDRGDDFNPDTSGEPAEMSAEALAEIAGEPTETEEDEAPAANGNMIPQARFNEVNRAKKTAEEANALLLDEIRALRAGKVSGEPAPVAAEVPAQPELSDMEREYIEHMLEGDTDKALEIRARINAALRAEAVAEVTQNTRQSESANLVNTVVASVLGQYPQFDDKGDQADAEAISELVDMRDFYMANKGMSAADAITKAAETVAKMRGFGAEAPAPVAGKPDLRSVTAIKRGAAVANAQPNTGAVGVGTRQDAGKINIETASEEEFESLSVAEKKRMRGD